MNGIVAYILAKKLSEKTSTELTNKVNDIDKKVDEVAKELVKQIESVTSGISDITVEGNDLVFTLQDGSIIRVTIPDLEFAW